MSNKVKTWFEQKCPFNEGTFLLAQLGGNVAFFQRYRGSTWVPKRVIDQLKQRLFPYLKNKDQPSTKETKEALNQEAPVLAPVVEEGTGISILWDKIKLLNKQFDHLHTLMAETSSVEKRYRFATTIMEELLPALSELHNQRRYFEKNGVLPEVEIENKPGRHDLERNRRNLKSRISRLKGFLKKDISKEKRKKYDNELIDKQAKIHQLTTEINKYEAD